MPLIVQSKWIWISSSIFGLLAGIIKTVLFPYPEFNPPAIYPAVIAFLTTALFWWWLIIRSDRPTLIRGGVVGAVVGLLTPVVIWPFFLLSVGFSENRLPETLMWAPVYMLITPIRIGWLTIPFGIIVGAAIAYAQQKTHLSLRSG